jgi:hypothetical protein
MSNLPLGNLFLAVRASAFSDAGYELRNHLLSFALYFFGILLRVEGAFCARNHLAWRRSSSVLMMRDAGKP